MFFPAALEWHHVCTMSMWLQLQYLCKKNKALHEKINDLYRRSSFPYKIRSTFAEWIEAQNWQVDLSSEEGRCQAEHLYQELLSKIQAMEEKMQAASNFDLERTMDFSQARDALKQEFNGNSCQFVTEVKRLREEEENLRYSTDDDQLRRPLKAEEPRATENKEIKQKLENLKHKYFAAESALRDLEIQQNEFLKQYRILLAQSQALDSQLGSGNLTEFQRNDIVNRKTNYENEKEQLVFSKLERRNAMIDTFIRLAIEEANTLQLIWQEIGKWHLEQKQIITGLVQPRKGSLELLDRMCDQGGELLYRMIQQVEQLLSILNKVNFQDDRKKHQLQIVLKELTNDYLPMHLRKTFIIEQNIPDRILKVGSGKSANFSMAVRILGGKAFGLDFSKPRVKMALFFEKDIPAGDSFTPGACEIINGDEKVFTVHHSTNACVAQFYSIQLRNVKRPDRGRNEELVTDQKFAFVFFTTISVCSQPIQLKVVSLPVILTSQTSQEIMAKGTLIWDAAFSDENRTPFQYREMTKWSDVAAVLNALFLQCTGRGLTDDHLNYLARIAFREKRTMNFNDMMISEKQLIKDKLPQRDFSFWKWFWANLNLVKDRIKKEWQDGSIYGFISKEDVKNKLMDLEPGTFLLRFSETNIEVSQRSDVSGYLTLSFVERDSETGQKKLFHVKEYLTPKEIQDKGLPTILGAMEVIDYEHQAQKKRLLWYLWPKKPFYEVFPTQAQSPALGDDYISGRYTIEIYLTKNPNHRQRQDSVDSNSISCPPSPQSSSTFSPINQLTVIAEGMDDIIDDDQSIEIPSAMIGQHHRPEAIVRPVQASGMTGVVQPEQRHNPQLPSPHGGYPPIGSPLPIDVMLAGLETFTDLDIDNESMFTIDSEGDLIMRNLTQ